MVIKLNNLIGLLQRARAKTNADGSATVYIETHGCDGDNDHITIRGEGIYNRTAVPLFKIYVPDATRESRRGRLILNEHLEADIMAANSAQLKTGIPTFDKEH